MNLYDGLFLWGRFRCWPLDSPWPMMSHDLRHTGRSPFNTTMPPEGVEIWRFYASWHLDGGVAIDDEGMLYFGGYDHYLYSVYPNGTLKWKTKLIDVIDSTPAIDENGILYVGTYWGIPNYFYAVFSNNGTIKWKYMTGNDIDSSPAIGDDGTIYFGDWNGIIHALNPSGTVKWEYHTGDVVTGSPAIGPDGTVYCGSHDSHLYAFFPGNGTVKWSFPAGGWVRVSPCVGDDGTVYCVSFDNNLYAINPDGTMKWKTFVNAGTNPTIGPDGTIYAGWNILYAVNPDGSVKWTYLVNGYIEGGTPCTSKEGIIYFGATNHKIIALNPDGTLRWDHDITGPCQSPPAIDSNGVIYIGSESPGAAIHVFGHGPLWAEANGPYTEQVNFSITFAGVPFGGTPLYTYLWDFGDNHTSDEQNPVHKYTHGGVYNAVFTIIDNEGNSSSDNATVTITYPPPIVHVTRPANKIYVLNKEILNARRPVIIGPITIEASVTPHPLPIVKVDFWIDGYIQEVLKSPPYQWTWRNLAFGRHTISAGAYDSAGNKEFETITVLKLF